MTRPPLGAEALLRRGLAALAAVSIVGTAVELTMLWHWKSLDQVIPWVALAVLAAGLAFVVLRPSRIAILGARVLSALVGAAAIFGVLQHVHSNYEAGPLDARYAARWDTMSELSRLWAAATESVGPTPPMAPGALALAAACVVLITLRHPAARGRA